MPKLREMNSTERQAFAGAEDFKYDGYPPLIAEFNIRVRGDYKQGAVYEEGAILVASEGSVQLFLGTNDGVFALFLKAPKAVIVLVADAICQRAGFGLSLEALQKEWGFRKL